jgi:hypothetical protein
MNNADIVKRAFLMAHEGYIKALRTVISEVDMEKVSENLQKKVSCGKTLC